MSDFKCPKGRGGVQLGRRNKSQLTHRKPSPQGLSWMQLLPQSSLVSSSTPCFPLLLAFFIGVWLISWCFSPPVAPTAHRSPEAQLWTFNKGNVNTSFFFRWHLIFQATAASVLKLCIIWTQRGSRRRERSPSLHLPLSFSSWGECYPRRASDSETGVPGWAAGTKLWPTSSLSPHNNHSIGFSP